jgi:hypothetical protein
MAASAANPSDNLKSSQEAVMTDTAWWAWLWGQIEQWAFLAVVLALAIEFAALKFGAPYKKILDDAKDLKIAELQAKLAPRRLSAEQKASIAGQMKDFPNIAFGMSAVGSESIDFATDLADALKAAGWRWIDWTRGGVVTKPPDRPQVGIDMLRGIETQISDPKLEPLATALFHALSAAGYKNHWVLNDDRTEAVRAAGLATPVIILIGSKE